MFEIKREDAGAISLVLIAMEKALFPLLEGKDHRQLAQAEVQISDLRRRLMSYQAELDKKAAEDLVSRAVSQGSPGPLESSISDPGKVGKKK